MAVDLSQVTAAEYQQMTEEEQLKVMTEVYRELFHRSIQDWSHQALDVVEALGINDYEQGASRPEIPLAFLKVCSTLLQQTFVEQHRHELQVMNADTAFAVELAEGIYDRVAEIQKLTEDVITLEGFYSAALQHRKESKVNLLDIEGNTKAYPPEMVERERLLDMEREENWKQSIRDERAELERAYRGEGQLPPLEEGYDSCQLPLPLWTAGYCVV